jgi:enoyl-CoA hydratase/carnithine racemase
MEFIDLFVDEPLGIVTLHRGKVNALNEAVVEQLGECLEDLADEQRVRAVILTGQGSFFSFGFDVPGFMNHSREAFGEFVRSFTSLYLELFTFAKPVVAAINGHAIAGGCMLSTACDYRLMVTGKARIALNEIDFGATVLVGSTEMLKLCVGQRNAESILYSGALFSAEEALELGLVNEATSAEELTAAARNVASELAGKDAAAFQSMKRLLRGPVASDIRAREEDGIAEFLEIWFSESTRRKREKIEIRP